MLENGTTALEHFTQGSEDNEDAQSSPGETTSNTRGTRQRRLLSLQGRRRRERSTSDDEPTSRPALKRNARRATRSQGLREVKMLSYGKGHTYDSEDDLVVSDLLPVRSSRRRKARRMAESSDSYTSEVDENLRRSGRTRTKASYVEPTLIDDDFIRMPTESTTRPKVVHSKEIFPVLEDDDDFTALHNPHCDTCGTDGHSKERGKLICCQGCSAAYHKNCIGQVRTSREHLVTKISDTNFVLQCKRCIGKYRLKDPLQAAFDRCVDCNSQGHSCAPFRPLGKPKRANSESRTATPDIEVPENLQYNAENVLFRCSICYRAWHYEHLPYRGSNPQRSKSGDNVRQERINHYTSDFKCLDCLSAPGKISNIIAWRPTDINSRKRAPETLDLNDFNDDERQYLVKFEEQSYFCVQWVPGAWVAGAFHGKKAVFLKNRPPPIMTEEEAIEEGFLRIEIVLDVEYTSYIPVGQDVDVDLARIKEVSKAYVKFKGLGYDEVFWEEPPPEKEKERWEDWRRAYDEFIHGFYVKPARNTVKKVERARKTKFELLELRDQPKYIKGGTLMQYQKEGMK
jgi:chromodomain-helicase-DNA-binding protein 4